MIKITLFLTCSNMAHFEQVLAYPSLGSYSSSRICKVLDAILLYVNARELCRHTHFWCAKSSR